MRINQPLTIENAAIQGVSVKHKDGIMTSHIKMTGLLTPALAALLHCQDVVYQEVEVPRRNFKQVSLDSAFESFTAHLRVEGLRQAVKLQGESVTDFFVEKTDDLTLQLTFRLHYTGDPLPFLGFWTLVGNALGSCTITPLQTELLNVGVPVGSMTPSAEKRVQ